MRKAITLNGRTIDPVSGEYVEAGETLPPVAVPKAKAKRPKPHFVPLAPEQAAEDRAWAEPIAEPDIKAEELGWLDAAIPPSVSRHAWLEDATVWARAHLATAGLDVPATVRVSVGLPFKARKATIGQCWHSTASGDGHREVFISPVLADGPVILATLIHELIHAALPDGEGHGPTFKRWTVAAGLEGKPTATVAGEALQAELEAWVAKRGPWPAAALDPKASGRKTQTTRLIKCECATCGYTARTTAKWLNALGAPICPGEDHGTMEAAGQEGGE